MGRVLFQIHFQIHLQERQTKIAILDRNNRTANKRFRTTIWRRVRTANSANTVRWSLILEEFQTELFS